MAAEKSYARLGLFLIVALVVVLATTVLFVQRMKKHEVIELVTYTDEDVSGLDISSPVRYRGVFVGRVTDVRIDPRGNVVEIDYEMYLDRLNTIGADVKAIQRIVETGAISPKLRARIVGNPVSGSAYLLLDAPDNPPPPIELGFRPGRIRVPSMPSTFASVKDRLPELIDRAEATFETLNDIVARIPDSLNRSDRFFMSSDRFFTNFERTIRESQLPTLSANSQKFFTTTSGQIEQITSQLNGVVGPEGTLTKFSEDARAEIKAADLPGTTKATRDAAESSRLAADDLRRSLPLMRDSVEQMRDLARHLDDQPESVVYGPRPQDKNITQNEKH